MYCCKYVETQYRFTHSLTVCDELNVSRIMCSTAALHVGHMATLYLSQLVGFADILMACLSEHKCMYQTYWIAVSLPAIVLDLWLFGHAMTVVSTPAASFLASWLPASTLLRKHMLIGCCFCCAKSSVWQKSRSSEHFHSDLKIFWMRHSLISRNKSSYDLIL